MPEVLTQASTQWRIRPDDERFLTLEDLHASVAQRKAESWTAAPTMSDLRIIPMEGNEIGVELYDPTYGQKRLVEPSNHGFSQLAQYASAPPGYLRSLPSELAAINLQWGLENNPMRPDGLVLAQSNGHNTLRAITSIGYGRIWDSQVVEAIQRVNSDGRWQVPSASYTSKNPLRATTLYASDHDVFIFLVDPKNPIEVPGEEPMFRGFFAWNSETGTNTFGLTTFIFRTVCDNRLVYGATEIKELNIRHTKGAPERFAYEGARYLDRYAQESTQSLVSQIVKAKAKEIEVDDNDRVKGMTQWLQKRGFSKTLATSAVNAAVAEEGQVRSLWDVIQGITAYARSIPFTDARVELEAKAGQLMDIVA